jgi:hypothetical protein
MYESRTEPLLSRREFALRLARHGGISLVLIAGSLLIGAVGYHLTEDLPWLDAVLNAAMILTGMGPVAKLGHISGKVFATLYALYSGVAFLAIAGLLVAPVAHRLLHRLHVAESEDT